MTYSFSRISSFHNCPSGWFLNYELKKEQEPNGYSSHGLFLHDLMEQHAKGEITAKEALTIFDDNWLDVEPDFPPFHINLKENFYKRIRPYFDREDILEGTTISVEEKYTHELPSGNLITGLMDRVFESDKKGKVIGDYKISTPYTKKQIVNKRRQLDLYAWLFHKETGEYPDYMSWSYFKDYTKTKYIPFDKGEMDNTIDWIESTIKEINGRLTATKRLGVKGLFVPNYMERIDEKTGERDYFCRELCGYKNNGCPFIDGSHLKMFKTKELQDIEIKK